MITPPGKHGSGALRVALVASLHNIIVVGTVMFEHK